MKQKIEVMSRIIFTQLMAELNIDMSNVVTGQYENINSRNTNTQCMTEIFIRGTNVNTQQHEKFTEDS